MAFTNGTGPASMQATHLGMARGSWSLALGLLLGGLLVGCTPAVEEAPATQAAPVTTQAAPVTTQVAPVTTQVAPVTTQVDVTVADAGVAGRWMDPPTASDHPDHGTKTPLGRELTTQDVQQLLRAQHYLVGPADGKAGRQTKAAVMAFQRVHGLEVDGVVGPITTAALRGPPVEPDLAGGPDDRIEVDLDLQLLHLVEDGERTATLHVSSGNGTTYVASSGNEAVARTPVGEFEIERRIHGVRHANLGILHDPLYFHRGFAIHGAASVPAEPASLGCVRVTIADGAWLIDRVPDGLPVHLYGGEHVYTPRR